MYSFNANYTAQQIISRIRNYESISFDLFDTLVKRTVASPSDLFVRVAKDASCMLEYEIDPESFKMERINAAKRAKEKAYLVGVEEVTIQQIYDELPDDYSRIKNDLIDIEEKREIACCVANPVMREVYEWCINNNLTVYIISDMYLSLDIIQGILANCGYVGYKKIYLSSNVGVKKQTGHLFSYFVKDSGVVLQKHIHLGDNIRTDYLAAKKAGLKAYKIPTLCKRSEYRGTKGLDKKTNQYQKIQKVIENTLNPNATDYYKYGYEVVGIMLYGFVCWLHEQFKEKKHDKVFFLARDGFLMQEAYNHLFGSKAVCNDYLYASRKSLFAPQLWMNPTLESILEPETDYRFWTCEEFCGLLGVNIEEGRRRWLECGLKSDETLRKPELIKDARVKSFFDSFVDSIVDNSKNEYNTVIKYLTQEGFNGSVGIVDVGWAGAIQKYLNNFIERSELNTQIYGYYLGLKQKTVAGKDAISYIPRDNKPSLFCSQLIEYPFTKMVGTTKGYYEKDNIVEPTLDRYEFDGMNDAKCTSEMQQGIRDFIHIMAIGYGPLEMDYSVAYAKLRKVTKSPSMRNVCLLGDLTHVNHSHTSYLAKPNKRLYYMAHLHDLKVDLSYSGWKVGFMRRLVRLPLPYAWLLEKVRGEDK